MEKRKISNTTLWIVYLLVLVAFYLLNHFYPFAHDDYAYCYLFDEHSDVIRPTAERVHSLLDIFVSQCNHYLHVHGRFVSHYLLQIFAGLTGKTLFNILNTFMIILFSLIFVKSTVSGERRISLCLIPLLLVLYFLPYPGQTIFWMTGALNYLWGSTFALLILHTFQVDKPFKKRVAALAWICFTFCAGWINESVGIPVSGGLFLYYLLHRKQLSTLQKVTAFSYCLGCLLIIVSPGTLGRFSHGGEVQVSTTVMSFLFTRTWNLAIYILQHPITLLTLLSTVLLILIRRGEFLRKHSLYLLVYACSFLFLWLLNLLEARIYFFNILCSWVLLFRYLDDYHVVKRLYRKEHYVTASLFILLAVGLGYAYNQIHRYHAFHKQVVQQIKESPADCFLARPDYPSVNNRFALYSELSSDPANYHNRVKAFYYGKNYIAAWPKEVYDLVIANKVRLKNTSKEPSRVVVDSQYNLYATARTDVREIHVHLTRKNKDYKNLTSSQQFIRKLFGTYVDAPVLEQDLVLTPVHWKGKTYFYLPHDANETIQVTMKP